MKYKVGGRESLEDNRKREAIEEFLNGSFVLSAGIVCELESSIEQLVNVFHGDFLCFFFPTKYVSLRAS
jgi:hypothetical protein